MTSIEKKMIVAIFVMLAGVICGGLYVAKQIENAGGVKQIIIDAGKDIKDTGREIGDH